MRVEKGATEAWAGAVGGELGRVKVAGLEAAEARPEAAMAGEPHAQDQC